MAPKKLAAICTVWFPYSHADVIVRRWLEPNPGRDAPMGFSGKETSIASVYLAQAPDNDVGVAVCEAAGVPLFATIDDALTLGTGELAVDGVLLIGEHGDYPTNALGQKLYPRQELFDAIVAVFEKAGRVVPLFCDKHFSYDADAARAMWATVQRLQIPWLAGSSTTLVGFRHAAHGRVVPPDPSAVVEGVATFGCCPEAYGFHSLEVASSVIGEAEAVAVTGLREEAVFAAIDDGTIPADLLDAALAADGKTRDGLRENVLRVGVDPEYRPFHPSAFRVEHAGGAVVWHVCLEGHTSEFSIALRSSTGDVWSGAADLGGYPDFFRHFAALDAQIEKLMLTGSCDVPPERTYRTTLAIAAAMHALAAPGARCVP